MPSAFLRAGWFMENSAWDIDPALQTGEMASFLHPLDRAFPLVATADVGRVAAETLQESWQGRRVLEIEGLRRYTPNEIALSSARLSAARWPLRRCPGIGGRPCSRARALPGRRRG